MIDLHTHVLPGLDDGVATMEEAVELVRRSRDDGVRALAATPHVRADYPTTPDEMVDGVTALKRRLSDERLDVEILPGGEVALERLLELDASTLRAFSLAGSQRYLLVEFPYVGWPLMLEFALERVVGAGLRPILAHPERNDEVAGRPERLAAHVEAGALLQLTAASLDGRLGRRARATAWALLRLGLGHLVASDAHAPAVREAGLASVARALGDTAAARLLTDENPAAVVAGDPVDRRVTLRRRRLRLGRSRA